MTDPTTGVELRLRRDLAIRLGPLAVLLVVVIMASAPLAVYVLGQRAVRVEARAAAQQVALTLRREAEVQPRLWKYDTPKLLAYLRTYEPHENVRHIEVVDEAGRLLDRGDDRDLAELAAADLSWESAPIELDGARVGEVWVAADSGDVRLGALRMLGVFALLGCALAGLMFWVPRQAMGVAERRIGGLVARLQQSQHALSSAAENLELQVEARSSELSRTLRDLQDKEQRVRELSTRAVSMQEAERRAIARELHDSAGQALTAIRIHLQLMSGHAERLAGHDAGAAGKLRDLVNRTAAMVDETLEEIRRAVNTLGPAVLDDVGLAEAVGRLGDDIAERLGITVDCRVDLAGHKLPALVETSCYRLVQEALTNVMRHAEADHVDIRVVADDDEVVVRVHDDGKGFEVGDPRTRPSRGLVGMRERAELLGGRVEIDSAPGAGTTVLASIPWG